MNLLETLDSIMQGNDQEGNLAVQEAIRIVMQRLSRNGKVNVTKKHMLKVLFLAKERLPEDNRIKHDLAYYWYREGPYSEVVYANLDHMMKNGVVRVHKTQKSETYHLIPERALRPIAPNDDEMGVVRDVVSQMAKQYTNVHAAVSHTYKKAPFKWYTTYNLEFRPKLESHLRDILACRKSRYGPQDILDRLDDAVLYYPTNPEFLGHRMIFMDFAKMLNALLRWDSYHTRHDLLEPLMAMCGNVWDVFTYMVRIQHHDGYYDGRVHDWTKWYKLESAKLDHAIHEHARKLDGIVVDDLELTPDMEDVILHPERHEFKPLGPGTNIENW